MDVISKNAIGLRPVFFFFADKQNSEFQLLNARILFAFWEDWTRFFFGRGSSLYRVSNGGVHCELVFSVSVITGNLFQHVHRLHTCSCQRWKSSAFLFKFSPPGLAHRRVKKKSSCLLPQTPECCWLLGWNWTTVYRGSGNNVLYTSYL